MYLDIIIDVHIFLFIEAYKLMQENLTKISNLKMEGMIKIEQIEILLELLLLYLDGAKVTSPILGIILNKAQETSKIFEEIEMNIIYSESLIS
jgi:hypothetical protein